LIYYPFVDLLGDGYSSFTYSEYILVSSDSVIAQQGSQAYGLKAIPANFTPSLDAYAFQKADLVDEDSQEIFLDAYTNLSTTYPSVTSRFKSTKNIGPWPLEL
jgi:hypothetical protein